MFYLKSKKLLKTSILPLILFGSAIACCDDSNYSGLDELVLPESVRKVTTTLPVNQISIPEYKIFDKSFSVFNIPVYATSKTPSYYITYILQRLAKTDFQSELVSDNSAIIIFPFEINGNGSCKPSVFTAEENDSCKPSVFTAEENGSCKPRVFTAEENDVYQYLYENGENTVVYYDTCHLPKVSEDEQLLDKLEALPTQYLRSSSRHPASKPY